MRPVADTPASSVGADARIPQGEWGGSAGRSPTGFLHSCGGCRAEAELCTCCVVGTGLRALPGGVTCARAARPSERISRPAHAAVAGRGTSAARARLQFWLQFTSVHQRPGEYGCPGQDCPERW